MPVKTYDPIEDASRDNKTSFINYMWDNPIYFEYVFGMDISRDHVNRAWEEVKGFASDKESNEGRKLIQYYAGEFHKEGRGKGRGRQAVRSVVPPKGILAKGATLATDKRGNTVLGSGKRTRRRGAQNSKSRKNAK